MFPIFFFSFSFYFYYIYNQLYILLHCYKTIKDSVRHVNKAKHVDTHTTTSTYNPSDRRLPTGSTLEPTAVHGDVSVSVLQMPASGGISMIGVYGCQVIGQSTYNIGTVIMSSTGIESGTY